MTRYEHSWFLKYPIWAISFSYPCYISPSRCIFKLLNWVWIQWIKFHFSFEGQNIKQFIRQVLHQKGSICNKTDSRKYLEKIPTMEGSFFFTCILWTIRDVYFLGILTRQLRKVSLYVQEMSYIYKQYLWNGLPFCWETFTSSEF